MKIKRFTAPTLKEAVEQMKKELGSDAIILESRKVKKDSNLSTPAKKEMEILAAVDEGINSDKKKPEQDISSRKESNFGGYNDMKIKSSNYFRLQEIDYIRLELEEIKSTMAKIADFLRYRNLPSLPENLLLVLKQLLDCEVEEELAKNLVQEIQMSLKGSDYDDLRLILRKLINKISGMLKTIPVNEGANSAARIIAFVGPTGVGKTTTIAKLATLAKLVEGKDVAIISADTFRIAAVQQLKTFANIAEIPFEVVYSPNDIKNAVARFAGVNQIFIDTTGRSQRDEKNLGEIGNMLSSVEPGEVHLVLSVTTKYKDILEILEKFKRVFINRIIFTKLDETTSLGTILNVAEKIRKPISYITYGQNVPEDVEKADSKKIAKMIVRRKFL